MLAAPLWRCLWRCWRLRCWRRTRQTDKARMHFLLPSCLRTGVEPSGPDAINRRIVGSTAGTRRGALERSCSFVSRRCFPRNAFAPGDVSVGTASSSIVSAASVAERTVSTIGGVGAGTRHRAVSLRTCPSISPLPEPSEPCVSAGAANAIADRAGAQRLPDVAGGCDSPNVPPPQAQPSAQPSNPSDSDSDQVSAADSLCVSRESSPARTPAAQEQSERDDDAILPLAGEITKYEHRKPHKRCAACCNKEGERIICDGPGCKLTWHAKCADEVIDSSAKFICPRCKASVRLLFLEPLLRGRPTHTAWRTGTVFRRRPSALSRQVLDSKARRR